MLADPSHHMGYTLHYYDLVLIAIVVSLAIGVVVGLLTPLSLPLTVSLLSLLALALVLHAIFVNGPVDTVEDLTKEVDVEEVPAVEAAAQLIE